MEELNSMLMSGGTPFVKALRVCSKKQASILRK
jgi:hypothetical protein